MRGHFSSETQLCKRDRPTCIARLRAFLALLAAADLSAVESPCVPGDVEKVGRCGVARKCTSNDLSVSRDDLSRARLAYFKYAHGASEETQNDEQVKETGESEIKRQNARKESGNTRLLIAVSPLFPGVVGVGRLSNGRRRCTLFVERPQSAHEIPLSRVRYDRTFRLLGTQAGSTSPANRGVPRPRSRRTKREGSKPNSIRGPEASRA